MTDQVLTAFGFPSNTRITEFGNGLINHTWRVSSENGDFILQKVNDGIFTDPFLIAENIEAIGAWLGTHYPDFLFPRPLRSLNGRPMIYLEKEGYFRMFPFIPNSSTIDVVDTPEQAYEAARKFGEFTRLLSRFPIDRLGTTLRDFHNLPLRYHSFRESLRKGNPQRITKAAGLIDYLDSVSDIVTTYKKITTDPAFHRRVTHHDTKISNVLFDDQGKGHCVIDLDTVMPGYFISDVGDMFRTYLSPATEEEADLTKIRIRRPWFTAIVEGYRKEMHDVLTPAENGAFVYAGEFMIYMQALRFLTDYLNDDRYYGSRYEGHNYIRALNQATLLQQFREQAPDLIAIAAKSATRSH